MSRSARVQPLSWSLALIALAMFGFGFALVPLYEKFCEITGLGGRTGQAAAAGDVPMVVDASRLVTVHFDATVNSSLPWDFEPIEKTMQVNPGTLYETAYIAHNRSAQTVVAQAVPSVAPGLASLYFNKTECFCFTEQVLEPGESREMPVRFFVDPQLPAKNELITLSYIIYPDQEATEALAATP